MASIDISQVQQAALFDHLAPDYKLLLDDWEGYQREQGILLADLFGEYAGRPVQTVLDCTCGIGTQCLGLARLGYQVTGTDISRKSLLQARRTARQSGLPVQFKQADIRQLRAVISRRFDAVISCDNSLPALLSESELVQAVANMAAALVPGGICVISIRNYQKIFAEKKRFDLRQIHELDGKRLLVFDLWDYPGDDVVIFTVFFVREQTSGWSTKSYTMIYRALFAADLMRILEQAGFEQVISLNEWHGTSLEFDYYLARKSS